MSINFDNPVGPEVSARIRELFGKPLAEDGKTFLFDELAPMQQREMTELANKAGQPVTAELHSLGDIKEMRDGTRYVVTSKGWRKLPACDGAKAQ